MVNKYDCSKTKDFIHEYNRMKKLDVSKQNDHTDTDVDEIISIVQQWSDTHSDVLNSTTELTDDQTLLLNDLYKLGYRYIAKDNDGTIYGYTAKPLKYYKPYCRSYCSWYSTDGRFIELDSDEFDLSNICNCGDSEPTLISNLINGIQI